MPLMPAGELSEAIRNGLMANLGEVDWAYNAQLGGLFWPKFLDIGRNRQVDFVDSITRDHFTYPAHHVIAVVVAELWQHNHQLNRRTIFEGVTAYLRRNIHDEWVKATTSEAGVWSFNEFWELVTNPVPTDLSLDEIWGGLEQMYCTRELKLAIAQTAEDLSSKYVSVPEHAQNAIERIAKIAGRATIPKAKTVFELLDGFIKDSNLADEGVKITWPLRELNRLTDGLKPGNLFILAAGTGGGKSTIALQTAVHVAETSKLPVLFFSFEMPESEIYARMLSHKSQIPIKELRKMATDGMLAKATGNLSEYVPHFFDDPSLSWPQISSLITSYVNRNGVGLVVFDYLQLMIGDSFAESENVLITKLMRRIKNLAMSLKIPILALSQFNREKDKRATPEPKLSDLRSSGSIEQGADGIIFARRPEKEGIPTDENGNSTKGKLYFTLPKLRNGGNGEFIAKYRPEVFTIYDEDPMYPLVSEDSEDTTDFVPF